MPSQHLQLIKAFAEHSAQQIKYTIGSELVPVHMYIYTYINIMYDCITVHIYMSSIRPGLSDLGDDFQWFVFFQKMRQQLFKVPPAWSPVAEVSSQTTSDFAIKRTSVLVRFPSAVLHVAFHEDVGDVRQLRTQLCLDLLCWIHLLQPRIPVRVLLILLDPCTRLARILGGRVEEEEGVGDTPQYQPIGWRLTDQSRKFVPDPTLSLIHD